MKQENINFLNTRDEENALKLIETAFGYDQNFYYKHDFLPLFDQRFDSHSINAYYNEKLIGHIGYCSREIIINDSKLPFCFIGGIAVDEAYRGQGLFKSMINKVIHENESSVAGFILWSSESQMYKKFGFTECGHIYQWGQDGLSNEFQKIEIVTDELIEKFQALYEQTWKNRVYRNRNHWQALKEMKSVSIYVDDIDNVQSYFLKGKGFDLQNVIHEFASTSLDNFAKSFQEKLVWSPIPNKVNFKKLWLGLARAGKLWPKSWDSIENTINQSDIMIGGIDSV